MRTRLRLRTLFISAVSVSLFLIILFIPIHPKSDNPSTFFDKLTGSFTSVKTGNFSPKVEVMLVGDVMLGRTVMTKSLEKENNLYPFEKVRTVMAAADLVFLNLEGTVTESCPKNFNDPVFCTRPQFLAGLDLPGAVVATLANNHTLDYREAGLAETTWHLAQRNILFTGLGSLTTAEIEGTTFGFLGFDWFSASAREEDFALVREADAVVDVLLVGVHWGEEYTPEPKELQKAWAARLVASGADAVAGHHPHWIQTVEMINGVPVYYSLGNFVFDQMCCDETRTGMAVKLTFQDGKIVAEKRLKTFMKNWAQPEFVEE